MTIISLTPDQVDNWDLICALRSEYPGIKLVAINPLRVANMGTHSIVVHPDIQPIHMRRDGTHDRITDGSETRTRLVYSHG